ncbi:zinc finger protein [Aphelenchoides avenae]|nr:zinc finger protein [Aphelenchus avenae]
MECLRTVTENKKYRCLTGRKCTQGAGTRHFKCKYCRFQKCFAAGMQVTAVKAAIIQSRSETPLDRLMNAQQATFVNRYKALSAVYGDQQKLLEVPNSPLTSQNSKLGHFAEYRVICDFLNASGILDYFDKDNQELCHALALPFLYNWFVYEVVCSTIRNFGHYQQKLFSPDETFVGVNEASVAEYYATDEEIRDPRHAAKLGLSLYAEHMDLTKKVAVARLDEAEHAVLILILLARTVQKLVGPKESPLTPMLNALFGDLNKYYEQTYEDFALRLDRMVHLADEFQSIQYLFDEHVVLLRLCGKQMNVSKIEETVLQSERIVDPSPCLA